MRSGPLVAAVAVAVLAVLGMPAARGQAVPLISSGSVAAASDVVNGRVLVVQSVDRGTEVHSLAMVQVDEAIKGDLGGLVFVEVPGGRSAGGLDVIVSHQPQLRVGDEVQLALVRSTPEEEAALTGGIPVYSIVGGTAGTAALAGSVISQAQANGDFTLTGASVASFPLSYVLNPSFSGFDEDDTLGALRGGFQQWVDDPWSDVSFVEVGIDPTADPTDYVDSVNTVGWVETPNPADVFLAQAVWVSSGGTLINFDIQFNTDYDFAWGEVPDRFDAETVNLHEVGHILGLGHTTADVDEVMYPSIGTETVKGLGAGDLSGIASLYPAANPPPPECAVSYPEPGPPLPLASASGYVAVEPFRVLDSRPGSQVGEYDTPWCSGGTRSIQVTGVGAVPAEGVTAVAMHVTSVSPTGGGSYISIRARDQEIPGGPIAVKNFGTGGAVSAVTNDLVIAQVGTDGMIDIYNHAGRVDLVIDIVGYFDIAAGDRFVGLPSARVLDTRSGEGGSDTPWGQGETRSVGFAGVGGVPAEGVSAVAVHVTSVSPTAAGSYVRATPAGSAPGSTAVKNFGSDSVHGALTNDLLILTLGPDGSVDFYNHAGSVDLVMDVVGYFTPSSGDDYHAIAPERLVDTRDGTGGLLGAWGQGETRSVDVGGGGTVPAGTSAVVLHVTSVSPTGNSYLTIDAPGAELTAVKNFGVNGGHTEVTTDLVIAELRADGTFELFNNTGSVHLVIDIVGYFA